MKLAWDSLEEDERFPGWKSWPGAVLLDDEIKYYASHKKYPLIPFQSEVSMKGLVEV